LEGVHRPHRAFDHRKQQRPVLVFGLEIADEGLGDQFVFGLSAQEGLIGDLPQHRDPGTTELGEPEASFVVVITGRAAVVTP
jgi:hypothetical protein